MLVVIAQHCVRFVAQYCFRAYVPVRVGLTMSSRGMRWHD